MLSEATAISTRSQATEEAFAHALVRAAATRSPLRIAVQCGRSTITYGELETASNSLAWELRARGVASGTLVGILLERGLGMIVALLGVLKAGGAYVPVDPTNPPARLATLLTDSRPALMISQEELRAHLPPGTEVLSLDGDRETWTARPTDPPEEMATPDSLAYVIYTSGSTGVPKGVQVEHRNVVALLDALGEQFSFDENDVHGAVASLAFDMSVFDIYATLTSGARLLIVPRHIIPDPSALRAYLTGHGATSLMATPTAWRTLIDAGWDGTPALRVFCGGEALTQPLADALTRRSTTVWNLYGPTEVTVWACAARLKCGDDLTLGTSLRATNAIVLDDEEKPVPNGEIGTLFLGGPQVARGYLNRAELTAERFIRDPRDAGERLYNTGDLVKQRADGMFEYHGRRDHQVKVRGYRVELGEIEAALAKHPLVRGATVVVRENVTGDAHLVAYVVASLPPGNQRRVELRTQFRRFLSDSLPPYMIPSQFIRLARLPLNAAGKVDRAALPEVAVEEWEEADALRADYVEPRTAVERAIAQIWEQELGIKPIGVTDDFFALGATSIAAAHILTQLERTLGRRLPVAPLFQAPTIAGLAALLDRRAAHRGHSQSIAAIQPHGTRTPIFCVHGGAGTILHLMPLARRLGDDQPFYGFQMRGLYGDEPLDATIGAMARRYINEMRTVQPKGPYILAGYCFGAIVAHEMARLLTAGGERVEIVFSFNGPAPDYIRKYGRPLHRPPQVPMAVPTTRTSGLVRRTKRLGREFIDAAASRAQRLQVQLRMRARFARAFVDSSLGRVYSDQRRVAAIFHITTGLERLHHARPWLGRMLVVQAEGLYHEPAAGWRDVPGTMAETVVIPGYHQDQRIAMAEPKVALVASAVQDALGCAAIRSVDREHLAN